MQKPHVPYFFSLEGGKDLSTILKYPYELFVETGDRPRLETAIAQLASSAPDFALSLTTESAYRHITASITTDTISKRFKIGDSMKPSIETCLHEAIINAVVHGNLGIESSPTTEQDFKELYAVIEDRIGKALYKGRRINIAVWNHGEDVEIRINDEGRGFDLDAPRKADDTMPYGRGLYLIRSLATDVWLVNRTLCMTFEK
jgi:anti-sigma regulatory factor (Ser/Thr protein kinase)